MTDWIWVRSRSDDDWRALNGAGAVVTFAFVVYLAAAGEWWTLSWVAILFTNMLQRACSGVLVGRRWALRLAPFAIPLPLRVTDITTVEVIGNQRFARVVLWADGKRHAVFRVRTMNDHLSSRDLALLLTPVLQARGSSAGLHDAVADEWVIPPAENADELRTHRGT